MTEMTESVRLWDEMHRTAIWGTCPEPMVARWAMRNWGGDRKNAGGNVYLLELGCGVGSQAVWLARHGFLVDAMDASEHAIRRARYLNQTMANVVFSVGTLPEALQQVRFNTYDGVVDGCCLQHVEGLHTTIAEVHRVLKPGGKLLSIFAMKDHHPGQTRSALDGAVIHRLSRSEIEETFCMFGGGLKLDEMSFTDGSVLVSHWVVQATK